MLFYRSHRKLRAKNKLINIHLEKFKLNKSMIMKSRKYKHSLIMKVNYGMKLKNFNIKLIMQK